jgi:hypothetical protein
VGQNNHIISHLQFVDETIDFKEVTMSNIWTMKVIFTLFELASGLKENYDKSHLIYVRVNND